MSENDPYAVVNVTDAIFRDVICPFLIDARKNNIDPGTAEDVLYNEMCKKYQEVVKGYPMVVMHMCMGEYDRDAFKSTIKRIASCYGKGQEAHINAHAGYVVDLYKKLYPNRRKADLLAAKSREAGMMEKSMRGIKDSEKDISRQLDAEDAEHDAARRRELLDFLANASPDGMTGNTPADVNDVLSSFGVSVPELVGTPIDADVKKMSYDELVEHVRQLREYEIQLIDTINSVDEKIRSLEEAKQAKKKQKKKRRRHR